MESVSLPTRSIYENPRKIKVYAGFLTFTGSGESGIRTHGDISATLDFESSALDQLSHLSMYAVRGVFCLFLLLVSRFIWNADTRLTNFMHR